MSENYLEYPISRDTVVAVNDIEAFEVRAVQRHYAPGESMNPPEKTSPAAGRNTHLYLSTCDGTRYAFAVDDHFVRKSWATSCRGRSR